MNSPTRNIISDNYIIKQRRIISNGRFLLVFNLLITDKKFGVTARVGCKINQKVPGLSIDYAILPSNGT